MSVEKLADGSGYRVRWRDSSGKSRRKKVTLWRDAVALDGDLKRKKAMGELIAHERGRERLDEFFTAVWLPNYGQAHVSARTLATYKRHWRRHVAPIIGSRPLRELTPEHMDRLVAKLSKSLAPGSVARIMGIVQGVLERAVEWRYIVANPAKGVRRPVLVQRRGRALRPDQIAAICRELSARSAAITRVLAWTGLRPGELRALHWADVQLGSLRVAHAVASDQIAPTKTRKQREISLVPEARKALLEWYLACGKPAPAELIFPSARGGVWRDCTYNNWQQLKWNPAVKRAGLPGVVPYDLRHTFASHLIAEGRPPQEVARQLGHSVQQTLATYAHEFDRGKSVLSECSEELDITQILSADGRF